MALRKKVQRSGRDARRKGPEPPRISDAEWLVMKVIWRKGEATANEVVEALSDDVDWSPKTIQTLITRLARKGALDHEKQGREYRFRPTISEDESLHAISRSFLQRVFDGELTSFVSCFLERDDLSEAEVKELKRILDQKRKE